MARRLLEEYKLLLIVRKELEQDPFRRVAYPDKQISNAGSTYFKCNAVRCQNRLPTG